MFLVFVEKVINNKKNVTDLHIGTNEFQKGYSSPVKLVKNESSDLLPDSRKFTDIWNYA